MRESSAVDLAVLHKQVEYLEKELRENEQHYKKQLDQITQETRRRIAALEEKSNLLESRIRLGKGVFIGIFFTLGGLGLVAFDKVRAIITTLRSLL